MTPLGKYCKIVAVCNRLDAGSMISLVEVSRSRGHSLKISDKPLWIDMWRNLLTQKVNL